MLHVVRGAGCVCVVCGALLEVCLQALPSQHGVLCTGHSVRLHMFNANARCANAPCVSHACRSSHVRGPVCVCAWQWLREGGGCVQCCGDLGTRRVTAGRDHASVAGDLCEGAGPPYLCKVNWTHWHQPCHFKKLRQHRRLLHATAVDLLSRL